MASGSFPEGPLASPWDSWTPRKKKSSHQSGQVAQHRKVNPLHHDHAKQAKVGIAHRLECGELADRSLMSENNTW